jgi:hypothetical protein
MANWGWDRNSFKVGLTLILSTAACTTGPKYPCSDGGQPAREGTQASRNIKKCRQIKDDSGKFVNDGKYFEWYPEENIALRGEYTMGKKSGRWIEYDKNGKVISDKNYVAGKEVPAP